MITKVRIEARGDTSADVTDALHSLADACLEQLPDTVEAEPGYELFYRIEHEIVELKNVGPDEHYAGRLIIGTTYG
jgi:hypothetical protein